MTDSSIRSKISVLSLKTVSNGATPSEESAAREMIVKLSKKLDSGVFENVTSTHQEVNSYRKYYQEGTLSQHISELDWDLIAKKLLTSREYYEYIQQTHSYWERRTRTVKNVLKDDLRIVDPMSLSDYRVNCHRVFNKIKNEKRD